MIQVIRSTDKAKSIYEIPVKWQMSTIATGNAASLEEAIRKVLQCEYKLSEEYEGYIPGTLEIDYDRLEGN